MIKRPTLLAVAALCGATLLAATPAASTPRAPRELRCRFIEDHDGQAVVIEAPGLNVLDQTARSDRFQPQIPAGVSSIMCSRSTIIPAAYDDEVLWLGMPLYIAEMGTPGRLGVLEINEGRYRFRFLEGAARPGEQAALDQRLNEFQARFQTLQRSQPAR